MTRAETIQAASEAARPDPVARANEVALHRIVRRVTYDDALRFDGHEVTEKRYGVPRTYQQLADAPEIIPAHYPVEVRALAAALYKEVFSHLPGDLRLPNNTDKLRDDAFVQDIREAHASRWSWVGNFEYLGEKDGVVRLHGKYWGEVNAPRADVEGPDGAGRARLRRDPVNETMQPSFLHLLGEEAIPIDLGANCRLYWNIGPEGAIPFVSAVSTILNDRRIPFQFKIMRRPRQMDRPDTSLLYFPRYSLGRIEDALPHLYAQVRNHLRWGTPPFTKRLAPGLAYSEDPGDGRSYGESRCMILATLLYEAFQSGVRAPDALVSALAAGLEARGYPLHRVHLNPDSNVDIRVAIDAPKLPLEEYAFD